MKFTNSFLKIGVLVNMVMMTSNMIAQERKLPDPVFKGGMPMNEVVAKRHSVRDFDPDRKIDDAVLGQLLWMTLGVNRPDAAPSQFGAPINRCNPTARNWQEIHAYVFGKDGIWEYIPSAHSLSKVKDGDHRALVAGTKEFAQEFVIDAPYSIVFVADLRGLPENEQVRNMAMIDAGIACENLNLACVSLGIATVPRATMDAASISSLLGFDALRIPVMNNPIGYPR